MNYNRGHISVGPSAVMSTPFVSTPQVKQGKPSNEELEKLSVNIAQRWKPLGRRLGIDEARLTGFDDGNKEYSEKPYKMLLHWMNREGSSATYKLLYDALCHDLVSRKDLAEELCLFCVE